MTRSMLRRAGVVLLAASALLAGCATGYKLDNTVQSFSGLSAVPASPTYRFERLPSQAGQPLQAQLEALATPALAQVGMRRDDTAAQYAVQVSVRSGQVLSPWADPWWDGWGGWGGWGVGAGLGRRHGTSLGVGFGAPFWPRPDQIWWQREVSLVMREAATNKVVFESRAVNEGPWYDEGTVLAAMFQAALSGFPTPPAGVRRVDLQVGGKSNTQQTVVR